MSSNDIQQASHLYSRINSPSLPIFLRTVRLEDAPSHARLLSAPEDVARSTGIITKQLESLEGPSAVDAVGKTVTGPSRVNMVVCLKAETGNDGDGDGDIVIGLGGFGAIKDWQRDGRPLRAGDAGVMVDPAHRGKGFATEAMRLTLDWGFTPVSAGGPQLDLVTITTLAENVAMVKLTEDKLKLKGHGVLRPAEHDPSKQEKYFEITPALWQQLKTE